ncbi:MAG: hypothetical protein ACFFDW_07735 [Candidatus Thorarchaeota archaeon]
MLYVPVLVKFDFLGKDSVEWKKEVEFPQFVINVLQELIRKAKERKEEKAQIFDRIGSRHVNDFLGAIVDGLTAKVFRTFHATTTVSKSLEEADISESDPEYAKKEAAVMANREAAIICNHMKQEPKNWDNRMQTFRERKGKADERIEKAKENQNDREKRLVEAKAVLQEKKEKEKEQSDLLSSLKEQYNTLKEKSDFEDEKAQEAHTKEIALLKKKIDSQKKRVDQAKRSVESATKKVENAKNSFGTAKERVYKAKEAYNKVESQQRIAKNTKVWNLGTSLKSYIDPRVYYNWGKEVDYDWRNYYSSALQKKFSWVEREDEE